MVFFRLISLLPLWALYLVTDFVFLVGYYVIRYRRKIVGENLAFAFPEKSAKERRQIERKFYRNLTDSFAETIKLYTMSREEINRRFVIRNPHIIKDRLDKGEIVLGLAAHFFHWEGQTLAFKAAVDTRFETVYHRVTNQFFDNLMKEIRGRFGGTLVDKDDFTRNYLKNRNVPRLIGLAADQRPHQAETKYVTTFMNRETYFYEGPEKMAKRYGLAAVYADVQKPKRGHYIYTYQLVENPPYTDSPAQSITHKFIELTEKNIRAYPELYLWSHNRWR